MQQINLSNHEAASGADAHKLRKQKRKKEKRQQKQEKPEEDGMAASDSCDARAEQRLTAAGTLKRCVTLGDVLHGGAARVPEGPPR